MTVPSIVKIRLFSKLLMRTKTLKDTKQDKYFNTQDTWDKTADRGTLASADMILEFCGKNQQWRMKIKLTLQPTDSTKQSPPW
jgi:hypothetical protein